MLPAQMTSWGFYGGAKVDFPASAGPVQIAPASIPPPVINGIPGWPQYWRGFNAAYDEHGDLLFYVISGYETTPPSVPKEGISGIFDKNGSLVANIKGCSRTIAFLNLPDECGHYLILTSEEQVGVTENGPKGRLFATDVILEPGMTLSLGGLVNEVVFETQPAYYSNTVKARFSNFCVFPQWLLAPSLGAGDPDGSSVDIAVFGPVSSSSPNWAVTMLSVKYSVSGGNPSFSVRQSAEFMHALPMEITGTNLGDLRFSTDGNVLVVGTGQQLGIHYMPTGHVFLQNWTSILGAMTHELPIPAIGVEVIEMPDGHYRIFYAERQLAGCRIMETDFNPITTNLSAPVQIANTNNLVILNRDPRRRVVWTDGTGLYSYVAATQPGFGTLTTQALNVSSLTNVHTDLNPVPTAGPPYIQPLSVVPYVMQGADPLETFDMDEICCEVPAPYHWENTSKSAMALPPVINGKTITIEGVFTVDQDLRLVNCQVFMRPGAKIDVSSGKHLQIHNTDIEACIDMWDGIYLNHPSSKITVLNAVAGPGADHHISHAINGIVLNNGAQYSMTRAKMIDNYHHLQLLNHTGTYANHLTSCLFSCNPLGIDRNPHKTDITRAAIVVDNVTQAYLGYPQQTLAVILRSKIEVAKTGIEVKKSSMEANHLDFRSLSIAGIDAKNGQVGGNTINSPWIKSQFGNDFEYMPFGIRVDGFSGRYNTDLRGNAMRTINNTGIAVWNCLDNRVNILGNNIQDAVSAGIWVYNSTGWYGSSDVDIAGNDISVAAGSTFANAGIYINMPFEPILDQHSDTRVYNNDVNNCFAGVYMVNVPMPNVYANDINLNDALLPGVRGAGIFGYACHSAVINNNILGSYAGGFLKSKIGIGIDNSSASAIDDNDISDYGDGIFVSGYCWQTTYNCNRMNDYGRGVVYNFAIVGPQGDINQPQGNQWTPNLVDGNAELFSFNVATTWDFWYQSNAGAAFVPSENTGNSQAFILKPTGSSSNCSFQRNQNLNPIVKRQQGFDQWPTDRKFGNHSWAQKSLNRSAALLASSQDYQVYRDSVDTTSLGGLARYESALMDGDFNLAQQIQPGLTWTSYEEKMMLDLLSIGQIYFQVGPTGLSVGDWAFIDSLANSEVEPNHMIVSAARAMKMYHDQVPLFNWVEDDSYRDTIVARFRIDGKAAKAISYEIQVYPIPADELMTISNPLEESLLCVLIGLDGKEVHRFEILHGENELNVSNFPAGVYFLNVNGKSYSKTVKVVIE